MFTQKARRADENTGRGVTPAKGGENVSPEGATEHSATPSGLRWNTRCSRGYTPACDLSAPLGLSLRIV